MKYDSELAELVGREVEDASLAEPMGEQERQTLLDALADLPENYLIALMLVDGKGMSYEEAAAASGFTKTTIATYVMRARAALRLKLPDYWTEPFR